MLPAELVQKRAERFQFLAAGLVHVYGKIVIDASARRFQKLKAVGLHSNGFQIFRPEEFLLRQAGNPLIGRKVSSLLPPFFVGFHDADHFIKVGKTPQSRHFFGGVVVSDSDLSDSDFPHRRKILPLKLF